MRADHDLSADLGMVANNIQRHTGHTNELSGTKFLDLKSRKNDNEMRCSDGDRIK